MLRKILSAEGAFQPPTVGVKMKKMIRRPGISLTLHPLVPIA